MHKIRNLVLDGKGLFNFSKKRVDDKIQKSRSGIYADTPENRRLKRVGQKYGSKKQEEISVGKEKKGEEQPKKEVSEQELANFAKQSSEKQLQEAIKSSSDEKVRVAAHNELERRQKEEHPQKEEVGKEKHGEEKKSDLKTVEGVEAEIERLRGIDTGDFDEIIKIAEEIQSLSEKRKELQQRDIGFGEVSFEEYRKGFKRFNDRIEYDRKKKEFEENFNSAKLKETKDKVKFMEDESKAEEELHKLYKEVNDEKLVQDFYDKESEKSDIYLKNNEEERISLTTYLGNGHKAVRNYLSDPENYNKEKIGSSMDSETVKEISDNLSNFIQNNKITEDLSLNRRVKLNDPRVEHFFKNLKIGDVYEDVSFSSSSLLEMTHFGNFNIEILAKKGSNVANADNQFEAEYLIDKGSKFRVLKTEETGMVVELL